MPKGLHESQRILANICFFSFIGKQKYGANCRIDHVFGNNMENKNPKIQKS